MIVTFKLLMEEITFEQGHDLLDTALPEDKLAVSRALVSHWSAVAKARPKYSLADAEWWEDVKLEQVLEDIA